MLVSCFTVVVQWQDQLVQLLPEEMQARAAQCEASTCQDHACCSQHEMPKIAKKPAGGQQQRSQRAGAVCHPPVHGVS